ncbi:insertion sequence transposase [Acrasis kona]
MIITLHFLKQYPLQQTAFALFRVSGVEYNKIIRHTMKAIVNVFGPREFDWRRRYQQAHPTGFFHKVYVVVDATECNIQRPFDVHIQEVYYSGKKKRHTLKYHVVCNISDGRIIDVHGPFLGRNHDITLARSWFEMKNIQLDQGELILGDKGYIGLENCLTPIRRKNGGLTQVHTNYNQVLGSVRIVVEQAIARIKKFGCLRQTWRNDRSAHPFAFYTCAIIASLEMRDSPVTTAVNKFLLL